MMKTIAIAMGLLALAGCNRTAVPAGETNQSGNGSAAATTVPALNQAFLVGRWTDNRDCNNATDFGQDGQFRSSGGGMGQWTLVGDRLTLSGEQSLVAQIVVIDQNTLEIVNPDGSRGRSTRC